MILTFRAWRGVNATEEALTGRDIAVESGRDMVKFVANLNLLLAMRLQVLKDSRIDHARAIIARHLDSRKQ